MNLRGISQVASTMRPIRMSPPQRRRIMRRGAGEYCEPAHLCASGRSQAAGMRGGITIRDPGSSAVHGRHGMRSSLWIPAHRVASFDIPVSASNPACGILHAALIVALARCVESHLASATIRPCAGRDDDILSLLALPVAGSVLVIPAAARAADPLLREGFAHALRPLGVAIGDRDLLVELRPVAVFGCDGLGRLR